MEAVTLRHVDKSYTTYGTEVVLTGQVRPSRTRQVLRDVSVSFPAGSLTAIVGCSRGRNSPMRARCFCRRAGAARCVPSTSRTYPIPATRRAPACAI